MGSSRPSHGLILSGALPSLDSSYVMSIKSSLHPQRDPAADQETLRAALAEALQPIEGMLCVLQMELRDVLRLAAEEASMDGTGEGQGRSWVEQLDSRVEAALCPALEAVRRLRGGADPGATEAARVVPPALNGSTQAWAEGLAAQLVEKDGMYLAASTGTVTLENTSLEGVVARFDVEVGDGGAGEEVGGGGIRMSEWLASATNASSVVVGKESFSTAAAGEAVAQEIAGQPSAAGSAAGASPGDQDDWTQAALASPPFSAAVRPRSDAEGVAMELPFSLNPDTLDTNATAAELVGTFVSNTAAGVERLESAGTLESSESGAPVQPEMQAAAISFEQQAQEVREGLGTSDTLDSSVPLAAAPAAAAVVGVETTSEEAASMYELGLERLREGRALAATPGEQK
jgi:hypothetical protein